jgi:hypothetical protein
MIPDQILIKFIGVDFLNFKPHIREGEEAVDFPFMIEK